MRRAWIFGFLLAVLSGMVGMETRAEAGQPASPPSFHVEVVGKGTPMIFIPGLSSSGDVWTETVAHYKADHECHVLTLAGFAGKPAIQGPFLETVRKDLAAYIRAKKLVKPVVVGHSLGGFMALWLAATEPDLVGKTVAVDSLPFLGGVYFPGATADTAKPMAERMRAGMTGQPIEQWKAFQRNSPFLKSMITDPKNIAIAAKWGEDSDPGAVGQAMYEMLTTDLRRDIARITVPTLVIGTWIGMQPMVTRDSVVKTFQDQYANLPGHTLRVTDTARHFVMFDDEPWLLRELDAFLKTATK